MMSTANNEEHCEERREKSPPSKQASSQGAVQLSEAVVFLGRKKRSPACIMGSSDKSNSIA